MIKVDPHKKRGVFSNIKSWIFIASFFIGGRDETDSIRRENQTFFMSFFGKVVFQFVNRFNFLQIQLFITEISILKNFPLIFTDDLDDDATTEDRVRRSRSPLSGDEGSHDELGDVDDGPENDQDGDNNASRSSSGPGGQSVQVGGNGDSNSIKRKKKTRTVFSRTQVFQLESTFDMKRYLSSSERAALATSLRLTETQVGYSQ